LNIRRLLPEHQRNLLLMFSDLPGNPDMTVDDPLFRDLNGFLRQT